MHSRSHYSWTKIACAASHQVSTTTGEPLIDIIGHKSEIKAETNGQGRGGQPGGECAAKTTIYVAL